MDYYLFSKLDYQLKNDHLQFAPNAKEYINKLVSDVEKISNEITKEKEAQRLESGHDLNDTNEYRKRDETKENEGKNVKKSRAFGSTFNGKNENDKKGENQINIFNENGDISGGDITKNDPGKTTNSLGLTMEGKDGINMAIIKGVSSEYNDDPNLSQSQRNKMRGEKNEQVLLKQNYQNLEELIGHLMVDDADENYLKLAKLNRLKVLMELSMKMVGRNYKDIGNIERNSLEMQANRFNTTYPLPGEEKPLEEINEKGVRQLRMPLKIVQEDGLAKIDINAKYRIDPSEFLTIYTNKLINHAQDSTGLQVIIRPY